VSRRDPVGQHLRLRNSHRFGNLSIAALLVKLKKCAEFDSDTAQLVDVTEHQQLRLCVDAAASRRSHVPRVADLQPPVDRVDIQVA
jgi:hypothetical protein